MLTEAVQDRLVANGGALGEGAPAARRRPSQRAPAGYSFGNANVWARGADRSDGHGSGATRIGLRHQPRGAPIAGIAWRLDNGIVAGVAATYVATSAKFKDGSRTK